MTAPVNPKNEKSAHWRSRISQFLDNLARPSAAVTDLADQRQVRFLASITLAFACLTGVRVLIGLMTGSAWEEPVAFAVIVGLVVALFLAYGLSRSRYFRYAPLVAVVALVSLIYGVFFTREGYPQSTLLWLSAVIIFASTLLSLRDTFILGAANTVFLLIIPAIVPDLTYEPITPGLALLIVTTILILVLNQNRDRLEAIRQEELTHANQELQNLSASLEDRVQERTSDLALASEVGRVVSQIRDLDDLLQQAVSLIRDRFDLYYTQIYLMDEDNQRLVLRAGTGTAGQTLLAQGHSLPLDEYSINGRAATTREPVIVPDTEISDFFRPNPVLPDTRSEMSVPLLVQEHVVGVIDLQSRQAHMLSPENLPAFAALAGQLAVAIANANLLAEMQETTSFLDSVIENMPIMLFVKEAADLRFVRWNKAAEQITGYARENFLGKNDYDVVPEEEAEFFTAKDREVLDSGNLLDIPEEPLQSADRGTRILHTTKVPIFDSYGRPKYLLGISEDITERKQIEAQLAERLKQLNLLNEIGREAEGSYTLDEFMTWVTQRIPQAMSHPEACVAAVTMGEATYGDARAVAVPRHMIEDLSVRGELVGRIHIAYLDDQLYFRDEDSALIGGVGRRVSSYVENLQLLERLQGQAENLQKVARISTSVAASRNPYQLVQDVAEQTCKSFGFYQTAVFLLEEDQLVMSGAFGVLGVEAANQGPRISRHTQKSLIARTVRTGEGTLINDVTIEPDFLPHPLLPKTLSEIVVPLTVGNQVVGALDIHATEKEAFSAEDLNIFTTLASQVAISLENARQYQQTQTALEELSSLQRVITGESWEAYMGSRQRAIQGYVANRQVLRPVVAQVENGETDTSRTDDMSGPVLQTALAEAEAFVTPVQVRGTTIGKLGVRMADNTPVSPDVQALLTSISQQVAEALERARLFEETELARAQTEQLFAGSERVVRATTLDEVLQALVSTTSLRDIDQVSMMFFDSPWGDQRPDTMTVVARWDKGDGPALTPVGTVYQMSQTPLLDIAGDPSATATIVVDVMTDERVNEPTKELMAGLGIHGMAVFPLVVGRDWIGVVSCLSHTPLVLNETAVRQINSLVDQAASVAQTQRLFEAAQARAQQEQILRQVSERVYSAVDAESVLRTAVQEVGRVLGLEAFVYLDDAATAVPETNFLVEKATNGANGGNA